MFSIDIFLVQVNNMNYKLCNVLDSHLGQIIAIIIASDSQNTDFLVSCRYRYKLFIKKHNIFTPEKKTHAKYDS